MFINVRYGGGAGGNKSTGLSSQETLKSVNLSTSDLSNVNRSWFIKV